VARVFLPRVDGAADSRSAEAASSSPELVDKLKVKLSYVLAHCICAADSLNAVYFADHSCGIHGALEKPSGQKQTETSFCS
jgi:hypothetical protein